MMDNQRNGALNIAYGVIGVVGGFAFLMLNLAYRDVVGIGGWVSCLVALGAGVFQLCRGFSALRRQGREARDNVGT
jgi:ABC-type uncharacterized transport system permease subunit